MTEPTSVIDWSGSMAAIIFWIVIFCATFFTLAFMICAIAEYFSNSIERRVKFHNQKKRFMIADIFPFTMLILFWIL